MDADSELIALGKKGKRYSSQFQVVLKGNRHPLRAWDVGSGITTVGGQTEDLCTEEDSGEG